MTLSIVLLFTASAFANDSWYMEGDFEPDQRIEVRIKNTLNVPREQAPIVISRDMLPVKSLYENSITPVDPDKEGVDDPTPERLAEVGRAVKQAETSGGGHIPYQLDDLDKDGIWDELFLMMDLPAGGTKTIYLYLGTSSRGLFAHETHAEFGSYGRHLVPWWESKVMGWKLWFPDSVDMYGKRRPELVSNHEIEGNLSGHSAPRPYGNDILWVASTFGAGGVGLIEDPANPEKVERPRFSPYQGKGQIFDTRYAYHIVVSGPLRSIARVETTNWRTHAGEYALTQDYTAYAGKSHSTCHVHFNKLLHEDNDYQVAAGMRRIMDEVKTVQEDNFVISIGRDLDLWDINETLEEGEKHIVDWEGIALFVPDRYKPDYTAVESNGRNHLLRLSPENAESFEYVMFGAWSEGFIRNTEAEFEEYVRQTVQEINTPPLVQTGPVETKE
jgi:hypothetical protein